ncbi:hypothetical protein L6164_017170 [Bauhinia variegata]|uniref:Uncharacterized protein n=1 Tax=Bauhinia variegata TaxID=167791 RepID=A0ACB9N8D4_BAUVA|nr:hypothetical protein L6164_017170 [Bauhinia variegata]
MSDNNLVIEIEAILAEAKPRITEDCYIYRVPYDIHQVNVDAYTPMFISIGPFHHFDQQLQNMEKLKHVYFKQFGAQSNTKLEDLIHTVKEEEPRLRCCYSENLEMSTDKLVKVMLVDACFIVELFYQNCHNGWRNLMKPNLLFSISLDLLLLENQTEFSANFTTCHFTDLLRTFHLQNPSPNREGLMGVKPIPTATAFSEAGGKFKTNESKCILDWQFEKGCLTIPSIALDNTNEILFRNMVALEQCHYPDGGYITDYVWAMDFLINTVEYVDILNKNGILIRWIGDDAELAKMFNSLTTNVLKEDFNSQYFGLFEEMNVFYYDRWHQMRATLKRDYCNTPWRTLATCAAIAILFLTLTQSIFSILQAV